MKSIKIGVRGLAGSIPARYVEEAKHAAYLLWLELPSGAIIHGDELTGVRLEFAPEGLATTTLTFAAGDWSGDVDLLGVPEIVLCDKDGMPLLSVVDDHE